MDFRRLMRRGFWTLLLLALSAGGLAALVDAHVGSVGGGLLVAAEQAPEMEAILVLGASVRPGGIPSPMLTDRLETGLALFRAGKAPRLLVSGDHGGPDYDEVNTMRRYLEARGVPEEAIFMDHAGFSTYESLYRARDVFAARRILVVSQEFHLRRALYLARELGVEARGVAADRRAYPGMLKHRLREVAARVKALLDARVVRPRPRHLGPLLPLTGSGLQTRG